MLKSTIKIFLGWLRGYVHTSVRPFRIWKMYKYVPNDEIILLHFFLHRLMYVRMYIFRCVWVWVCEFGSPTLFKGTGTVRMTFPKINKHLKKKNTRRAQVQVPGERLWWWRWYLVFWEKRDLSHKWTKPSRLFWNLRHRQNYTYDSFLHHPPPPFSFSSLFSPSSFRVRAKGRKEKK